MRCAFPWRGALALAAGQSPAAPVSALEPGKSIEPLPPGFFDWDKACLTARMRRIIAAYAQESRPPERTLIEVNGYTDTSGRPRYNQGLSVRRAQSVTAELVGDGVPRGRLTIQGFGATHLLAPIGPGPGPSGSPRRAARRVSMRSTGSLRGLARARFRTLPSSR
jgi:outer membrane protein OmpA-like peptidoglycan-associated protein